MTRYINIHTHKQNNDYVQIVNANLFQDISNMQLVSIGIHPWEIKEKRSTKALEWIFNNATNSKVLAIGECGIDRAILTSIETQLSIFEKQVEIAEQINKPVIIHCVRAYSDVLFFRKKIKPKQAWIIHGFIGNKTIADQLINQGCFLSFGKALLYNKKLQNVFQELPLDYIFFETDDSDFKIHEAYNKAAEIHHICVSELQERLEQNFLKAFNVKK